MFEKQIAAFTEMLDRAGVEKGDPKEVIATKMVHLLVPQVEVLTTNDPDHHRIRITASPYASAICCIASGDDSLLVHTGENGIEHTLVRIGNCALAVNLAQPDAVLIKIEHIQFRKPIPLGAPVVISVRRIPDNAEHKQRKLPRKRITYYLLEGVLAATGEELFKPSKVTTAARGTK